MTGAERVELPPAAVVVLDVDDTLYLERDYVKSGFDAVGEHLQRVTGIEGFADTLWSGFNDGVRGDAFDRALMIHGLDPNADIVSDLVACYRNHSPTIELLPDAARFLSRLGGRTIAVITDGPTASQRAKVEALGLDAIADPVILTSELGPGLGKPNPTAYLLVEQHFDVAPDQCCYIADNPVKDFVTPAVRGWASIRIRRSGSLHHERPTQPPTVEVRSLDNVGD